MSGPLDPLPARATEMLERLTPHEQDDPAVIAVMRAAGDELDAVVDLMTTVRDQAWVNRADDTYGLLAIHEKMLHLPVAPPTATLIQRQTAVTAAIQSRKVGAKSNWRARLDALMRGNAWSYQEDFPDPGILTIRIPYATGSYSAAQVQALTERITPAHLEIVMTYDSGFIAGVSRAGLDAV